jgi:maltooligosyltrehalose trehalohydrolase
MHMAAVMPGIRRSTDGNWQVRVWAPQASRVELHVVKPAEQLLPLERGQDGYWQATFGASQLSPGTRYFIRLNGHLDRPDPASRSQPSGVYGSSAIVDDTFDWTDQAWKGRRLGDMVIYELHVGTFSAAGTFSGVIERLDELVDLGINTIEVMPIAQCPGRRNWGYDGVYLFAAQNSYGALAEFKRLVNECHARGLAVLLDVVYNHLGPEGNFLRDFGPYFTNRYRTPWGEALNFDGPESAGVRNFFIANTLQWIDECHCDGLRLDAVHAVVDNSPYPFWRELADVAHEHGRSQGRPISLIAETNQNDPKIVQPSDQGGFGLDGQWPDDFSRSLQTLLTGDRRGFYVDFGSIEHLAKAYREAFVLTGQHSQYRGRPHGHSAAALPADKFVVCSQNHDQVGNREGGERLTHLVDFESLKLAATAVILSPYVPLLFMGEEYAESAPFCYFVDHGDRGLCEAVRKGRAHEFASHGWKREPHDPSALSTFEMSKLNHLSKQSGHHAEMWRFYQELLRLRRELAVVREPRRDHAETWCDSTKEVLVTRRWNDTDEICLIFNFGSQAQQVALPTPNNRARWSLRLNTNGSTVNDADVLLSPRGALLLQAKHGI